MRQSLIAIFAMLLVLAVAAFDDFLRKDTVPKVRISGTVSQLSGAGEKSLNFRLGSFPFDLGIDAQSLALLTKRGLSPPFNVGMRVDAIVAKSEVAMHEQAAQHNHVIPVLALLVNGEPILGTPEALRVAPSMRTWPYLLLISMAGAALFFGRKRQRRRSPRV